jgi:hypothetical protein
VTHVEPGFSSDASLRFYKNTVWDGVLFALENAVLDGVLEASSQNPML